MPKTWTNNRSAFSSDRPWIPGCYPEDSDFSYNSGFCPSRVHHIPQCPSAGQCPSSCRSPLPLHPSSSTQCSRLSSEEPAVQAVQVVPAPRQDSPRASPVPVSSPLLPVSPNLLRFPPASQGCVSSVDGRLAISQDAASPSPCVCPAVSLREAGHLTCAQNQGVEEKHRHGHGHGHGHHGDSLVTCAAATSKSVWVDWPLAETCPLSNVASSRVCLCSQCSAEAAVVLVGGSGEHVCGEPDACVRTRVCSQPCALSPPREPYTCAVQRRHSHDVFQRRHSHEHHVIHRVSVASGRCESPGCRDNNSSSNNSNNNSNNSSSYSRTCPACPCARCHHQRLQLSSSPLTRHPLKQPELCSPNHRDHRAGLLPRASNTFPYCHSHSHNPDPRQSSCSRKHWTRMVRMRYVGRCLLALVLLGFGGLLAHVSVRDSAGGQGGHGGMGSGALGAGVVLGGGYHSDILMKMQMRPVPLSEFQARLRTVRNKFDLLRIFLADEDVSDETLMRLLTALVASSSSHALGHADLTNIAVTSRVHDDDAGAESHIEIAAAAKEERRSRRRRTKSPANWDVLRPTMTTPGVQSVLGRNVRENAETKDLGSSSSQGQDKAKRGKLGRETPSPADDRHVGTPLPREDAAADAAVEVVVVGSTTVKTSATTTKNKKSLLPPPPQGHSKPVSLGDFQKSTPITKKRRRTSKAESDVQENTSPFSLLNIADVNSDVSEEEEEKDEKEETASSSVEVLPVKSKGNKDASVQVSSHRRKEARKVVSAGSFNAPGFHGDVKEAAGASSHDVMVDDVQVARVQKRAEHMYDDAEYSAEEEEEREEEVREEDYLDEEVGYYNDAAHADALLEELEEAVHHISEMENNPQALCRDPLPQVVYIEDPKKQNRQFYPECTVIHRCRNDSGCCGRNYECGPKYEQVIFRTFLAVTVNTTSYTVLPDSRMVERIALVNHTQCQCREKPRLPDCQQACPGVFRMYRYGAQCVCDCRSSANERFPQCDDVKDGLYPLPHDDLVCIKSGRCGQPRCSVGQFDVATGFCPLKDLYTLPSPLLSDRLRRQYQLRHQRSHQHRPAPRVPVEGSGDF